MTYLCTIHQRMYLPFWAQKPVSASEPRRFVSPWQTWFLPPPHLTKNVIWKKSCWSSCFPTPACSHWFPEKQQSQNKLQQLWATTKHWLEYKIIKCLKRESESFEKVNLQAKPIVLLWNRLYYCLASNRSGTPVGEPQLVLERRLDSEEGEGRTV